jgi:hypothetical protein
MGKKLIRDSIESPLFALQHGHSIVEELKDEMGDWRDNMEGAGTGLENTDKFQRVSEAADTLESAEESLREAAETAEALENATLPVTPVEYSYYKPYGRKMPSRYDRLGEATSVLQGALEIIDAFVQNLRDEADDPTTDDEVDLESMSDAEREAAEKAAEEADEKANDAVEEVEGIADQIREAIDECQSVDFPGMFG